MIAFSLALVPVLLPIVLLSCREGILSSGIDLFAFILIIENMSAIGGIKKKLNRADYMFAEKENETLVKKPGDINGLDFAIRYLTDCSAAVYDHTA